LKRALDPFLLLLLTFPYVVLLLHLSLSPWTAVDYPELWWALKNSLQQSFLSAALALLLGCSFSLGLFALILKFGLNQRYLGLLEGLLLLPSLLPPIFVILICFHFIDPFPFGILGIALAHAVTYAGLVAVHLKSFLDANILKFAFIAELLGASRWRFWRTSLPLLIPELCSLFVIVLLASFSSFSIPLVMGGGRGTTLEILIYEKFKIEGNIEAALLLSILQMLAVFALVFGGRLFSSRFVERFRQGRSELLSRPPRLVTSWFGAFGLALFLGIFWLHFLWGIVQGWKELWDLNEIWTVALATLYPSLVLALGAGFLLVIFFFLLLSKGVSSWLRGMVQAWASPPTALVGLALILVNARFQWNLWGLYILGFVLMCLSPLYRWGFQEDWQRMQRLRWIGDSHGASWWVDLRWIVLPYFWQKVWRISGVGAVWMLGDFALGKIILGSETTLPLLIEGLVNSYRLDAGIALSGMLMLLSLLVWMIFRGVSLVVR